MKAHVIHFVLFNFLITLVSAAEEYYEVRREIRAVIESYIDQVRNHDGKQPLDPSKSVLKDYIGKDLLRELNELQSLNHELIRLSSIANERDIYLIGVQSLSIGYFPKDLIFWTSSIFENHFKIRDVVVSETDIEISVIVRNDGDSEQRVWVESMDEVVISFVKKKEHVANS
ncbi:hypothetical protein [Rubritalea marina]|uniref:hypothetical protein n=1 Tax=Rubritalea marina TaxID=361055 RepID=UPI00037E1D97|nr:hypothetical protein [Rubritalea marina]